MGGDRGIELNSEMAYISAASTVRVSPTRHHMLSRGERNRILWTVLTAVLLIMAASLSSKASELNAETVTAWDRYLQVQNARVTAQAHGTSFLWTDESPDRIRRLREGEIVISPLGQNPKPVPYGLIHHWIGAMFVPNTRLEDVLRVVRDYGRYKQFYAPTVIDSRPLRQEAKDDAFSLRMLNKAVVAKFALDAEFQSSYAAVDEKRWYSIGYSTDVREIEEFGEPGEHALPSGTGHGFIWRLYNVSRFEQRDGGVYVELEAAALSRDVPNSLRWIANPVIRRVSKSSMVVSLRNTQAAVAGTYQVANHIPTKHQSVVLSNSILP
jgi:hypothetical protein